MYIVQMNSLSDASSDARTDACTKCQQHSTHRYSYLEAPEFSSNSSSTRGALGDPVRPTRPRARGLVMVMFSQYWKYVGSHNSQSALVQYSVLLFAPFLVTVGAIWAVSKDCSDCITKANYPTPESAGMVSFPVHVSKWAVLGLPVHLACCCCCCCC